MHQVVHDSLFDYGRLEWQQTLHDLQKIPDVAYDNVLDTFDSVWYVKGHILTRSNLSVTRKVRPHMVIIPQIPTFLRWFSRDGLYFPLSIELVLNLCPPP